MKRNAMRFLFIVVLIMGIVGCAQQAPAPAPAPQAQAPAAAPAQQAAQQPAQQPAAAAPKAAGPAKEVAINVWAQVGSADHFRGENPEAAATAVNKMLESKGAAERVVVKGTNDTASWADYKKKFTLAADAGQAPQIILAGHEDSAVWGNSGLIVPFDKCKAAYPEFNDVIPSLWKHVTWKGQLWGVPQDTEARPMYYNKELLAKLGWSQADIDSLPERIKKGEWTLQDLIKTGKDAVARGVVQPGFAYWHRTSKGNDFLQYYFSFGGRLFDESKGKLVVNKAALTKFFNFQRTVVAEKLTPENYIGTEGSIFHDTVTHGKALFFNAGVWSWADWAKNYAKDLGGNDYLYKTIGYALQPAGEPGQKPNTLTHPLVYMITAPKGSGGDAYDLSCAVLAKTTTAELNTKHAVESMHLGILTTQAKDPEYGKVKLLADSLYMLDYAYSIPNVPEFGPYFDIMWDNMVKAENGTLAPDKAAEEAIKRIQVELGDMVIVE